MADQNVRFLAALIKLNILGGDYRNHPKFQALPVAINDPRWDALKNPPYELTFFELGALKNVRCALAGT